MAKINTLNYQTVAAWNGSQDLFVVEQPDGTKVATPAMVKQFIEAGDFEATGEIEDGHGNNLNTMAATLSNKADTSYVNAKIAGRCEGGNYSTSNTSLTGQMNAIKTSGKSGVYSFYCSNANTDFSTIGYCSALGFLGNGNVSSLIAVNSQTGDLWTNGNTSQSPNDWIGWKNISAFSVVSKGSMGLSETKTIDVGSTNGIYILILGHGGSGDMLGLYLIKVTHYQAGTVVKPILTPATAAPTITATGIAATGSITIKTTSALGCNYSLYRCNLTL